MTIQTTTASAYPWRPDLTDFAPVDVIPDALILQCATPAGFVDGDQPSVRVAYVDDAAADFVAEAATIPAASPDLAEVIVHTGKISQLIRLSNEQYKQEGTAGQLAQSVARAIIRRADEAFIAQAVPISPAVTPPAGLLNISGLVDGGEVDGNLDALADLLADLQSALSVPSHIIVDPQGWAGLRKLKVGGDQINASLLGAGTTDALPLLFGLPVLVNPKMTPNTGLVIDRTQVVAAVGQVVIAASTERYFESDSVALRATWRIGWNAVRPGRLGKFTVAGEGS